MTSINKNTCNVYIISWKNFHNQAIEIAKSLIGINGRVVIVHSDPNPDFLLPVIDGIFSIRTPEEEFFGLKFKACIQDCDSDFMMLIHADCEHSNWRDVYLRGHESIIKHSRIGIWTPHVEWNSHHPDITNIGRIGKSSFVFSAWTDTLVFCIRKKTVERMKRAEYSENNYGWGITPMLVAHVCTLSLIPVVDHAVKVIHHSNPSTRGYPSDIAAEQKHIFLKQLSAKERVIYDLMNAIQERNKIIRSLKNQAKPKNSES